MHYLYKKDLMDLNQTHSKASSLSELTRITDKILKAHNQLMEAQVD